MLKFFLKFKEIFIFFGGIIAFLFAKGMSDKSKDKKIEKLKGDNRELKGQNDVIAQNIKGVGSEIKNVDAKINIIKDEIASRGEANAPKGSTVKPKKFFDDRGF